MMMVQTLATVSLLKSYGNTDKNRISNNMRAREFTINVPINIKINGKKLEDPNLSVRFTDLRVASGLTNVGDSSNVSNYDIAYMRFLETYNKMKDLMLEKGCKLLTTPEELKNVWPDILNS